MNGTHRVYLDWAATAPLCDEAAEAMQPFFTVGQEPYLPSFNANSLHTEGREAFQALEQARTSIARCIDARPDEIIATSGATESNYMALLGIARAERDKRRRTAGMKEFKAKVISSAIEHDAVLQALIALEHEGFLVERIAPNKDGAIPADALRECIDSNTVLVSIMTANNEVGSIQPIAELAHVAHEQGAFFHTDAVQALGKLSLSCKSSGIDAASFSAHKIGGPKGVGILYLKAGTNFAPVVVGGGQEHGLRGGTQNVAGLVGFAAAMQASCSSDDSIQTEFERLAALRDCLYQELTRYDCVHASVMCPAQSRDYLPHIVNVCVDGVETETLILQLDLVGFAVSGGSACGSHSLEPSHVLTALGIPRDRALGSLRISLGRTTTKEDIDAFLQAFQSVIETNTKG